MTDAEIQSLARQAEALLGNRAFAAALDRRRQGLLERIAASEPGEQALREQLYLEARALRGVEDELRAILTNGEQSERREALVRRVRARIV